MTRIHFQLEYPSMFLLLLSCLDFFSFHSHLLYGLSSCFHIIFFCVCYYINIDFATTESYDFLLFYFEIIERATTKNHIRLVPRSLI